MPARVRGHEIVVVVNVPVGLGSMKFVEVVVVIHCKQIAGSLGPGPTGPADAELDSLAGEGHHKARDELDMLAEDVHRKARDELDMLAEDVHRVARD